MSWISELNKKFEKRRESLREKGYDPKRLDKIAGNSLGGKITSEIHKNSGQMEILVNSDNRKKNLKESLENRTFEERSELSKKGWAKEDANKEHISNLGKEHAEVNGQRLREINQNSDIQSNRGKKGGKKGGPITANKVYHCQYCNQDFKHLPYNRRHGEKCKENPNRVIVYNYELVNDNHSYGKFEELSDIANYLKCSPALISKYMSGKKKDIKGYQIISVTH
jgi:hypothetical protein